MADLVTPIKGANTISGTYVYQYDNVTTADQIDFQADTSQAFRYLQINNDTMSSITINYRINDLEIRRIESPETQWHRNRTYSTHGLQAQEKVWPGTSPDFTVTVASGAVLTIAEYDRVHSFECITTTADFTMLAW